jgi:hypothetical protein
MFHHLSPFSEYLSSDGEEMSLFNLLLLCLVIHMINKSFCSLTETWRNNCAFR